jgi:tetratricopeptide (TPR) repeat protein
MRRKPISVAVLVLTIGVLVTVLWPQIYQQYLSHPASAYIQHSGQGQFQSRVYRVALSEEGQTLFRLATTELLAGKQVEAEKRLVELTQLEPNSAGAHEQLGRARLLSGKRDEAESAFASAFSLASGDIYMEKVLSRWVKLAREGNYTLRTDRMIAQQFPGQLSHFIEHRALPLRSGLLGASHILIGERRLTFPTPTAVPFEILERAAPGRGTVIFGSSRAREAFKAKDFEAAVPTAYTPAVNFAASQSAPRFWRGVLDHLDSLHFDAAGKRLKCAIVLADPESLSDTWARSFKAPSLLPEPAWSKFLATSKGTFELWPNWTGLTDLGEWSIPNNWAELTEDPFANGLNHARQGTAYVFDGVGDVNSDAFVYVLSRLQQIAEQVIVVATPLSPQQFELATAQSTYPAVARLTKKARVPFVMRPPQQWTIDSRHFFGPKGYPLEKMDWWHLNYVGAVAFTRELAKLVTQLQRSNAPERAEQQ